MKEDKFCNEVVLLYKEYHGFLLMVFPFVNIHILFQFLVNNRCSSAK